MLSTRRRSSRLLIAISLLASLAFGLTAYGSSAAPSGLISVSQTPPARPRDKGPAAPGT
jgi:hypothetical protein